MSRLSFLLIGALLLTGCGGSGQRLSPASSIPDYIVNPDGTVDTIDGTTEGGVPVIPAEPPNGLSKG